MKCESCRIREAETEVLKYDAEADISTDDPIRIPYRLCPECRERLLGYALRPLELFNLAAIHGEGFYLHDDFYDYETGKACVPEMKVTEAKKFPYPKFKEVENDPRQLVDYAIVHGYGLYGSKDDRILNRLQRFDKQEVFEILRQKIRYNPVIREQVYALVADVVGREAEAWAEEQWQNAGKGCSTLMVGCLDPEVAFARITGELEQYDDRRFGDGLYKLCRLRSRKTLDWLETQTARMTQVTSAYGQVVACSGFDWERCERWLELGRPLSLVALDALWLCTLSDYGGQSLLLEELKPRLEGTVGRERIEQVLRSYLERDKVARTRMVIGKILDNLDR